MVLEKEPFSTDEPFVIEKFPLEWFVKNNKEDDNYDHSSVYYGPPTNILETVG